MTTTNSAELYQQLLPKLTELEKERKRVNDKAQSWLFAIFGVVLVIGCLAFIILGNKPKLEGHHYMFCLIPTILIVGIMYGYRYTILQKFRMHFKSEVITDLVKTIDSDLEYNPKKAVPSSNFKESKLFRKSVDRYKGEDFISGKLGKTVFQLSEVHAEYESTDTDDDGHTNTSYHTIFKGLFMVADFHKHFEGQTFVLPDHSEKSLGGWFSKKLQSATWGRGELIQMEDVEFEKEFKIYTSDIVEARYILSPKLMRDILDLKNKFDCRIYLSFINSNVYMGLSTRHDFMEIDLNKSLLDPSTVTELMKSIFSCINLIEDLNLNTRIWSKQA